MVDFHSHRPPGYTGKGEHYLPRLAGELERVLTEAQESFEYDTLYLSDVETKELANILVEFGEDIHNGIGIWHSLEQYNMEFFGTPLPFVLQPHENMGKEAINEHRIQHLLWVLYSELDPRLILSPKHSDLTQLAQSVSDFLRGHFAKIPQASSIKRFLSHPDRFGWDVKRKLIWLGTHSYLFRTSYRDYVEEQGGKPEIPVVDDFICAQTTAWSGLGVIDILAAILDLSEEQRSTLRSWYERHLAYYRIHAIKSGVLEAVNIVNDKAYTVRMGDEIRLFRVGQIVLGSLVPWDGEWYWSSEQRTFDNVADEHLKKLKDDFLKRLPLVAYRYCSQLALQAKEMLNLQYHEFVKYHGDDLAIYPDGLTMAADLQKEVRLQWESKPKEVIEQVIKEHKLNTPGPDMSFPPDILESEKGIGVYFNPDEGQEIMTGFNYIISGLKKKGIDLNKDEENSIRSFIRSDSISPQFVRRLVQEYGYESIQSAFLLPTGHDESHLNYLLRRYKGAYYRKRYANLSLV